MQGRNLGDEIEYPGHGMPGGETPQTLYALLAKGKPLGKKVDLLVSGFSQSVSQISAIRSTTMLEARGDDVAAMNLQITLAPPKVIPLNAAFTAAQAKEAVERQNASGTSNNDSSNLVGPNFQFTPIIALLEWGVGGYSNDKVEVDFSNGLCVNLTASYVRISASIDPYLRIVPNTNLGSPAVYELAAFIGPGWAKPRNAQRTIALPQLAPTECSPIIPIPRYATSVKLVGSSPGTGAVPTLGWLATVVFFCSPGTGPSVLNPDLTAAPVPVQFGNVLVADNGSGPGSNEIAIPNGAYFAAVINNGGDTLSPRLVFDLGI